VLPSPNVKPPAALWRRGWPKILIPAIALILRLAVTGLTFHGNAQVVSWEDVAIAKNLLAGNGYSIDNTWRNRMLYSFVEDSIKNPVVTGHRATILKPPVFPFVLVLLFSCFGNGNFLPVFILNSTLSALTALFLYLTLEKRSKPVAFVASLAFAIYPPFVFHCATTPESTFLALFLISVFLYQCDVLSYSPTYVRFLLLGVTGGLMILTNPVLLHFVISATLVVALVLVKKARDVCRFVSCSMVGMLFVISPWVFRNQIVFHKPVLKVGIGHALLRARYTSGDGLWMPKAKILKAELRGRTLDEVEEDQLLASVVVPAVKNAPFKFAAEVGNNFYHLWWEPRSYQGDYSLKYLFGRLIPYILLLTLSLISILRNLLECSRAPIVYARTHCIQVLAFLLILGDTFTFSIFGAWNIRYHFPSEFAMLPFFAESVVALLSGSAWLARLWSSPFMKRESISFYGPTE
jgi:hypothetical protein